MGLRLTDQGWLHEMWGGVIWSNRVDGSASLSVSFPLEAYKVGSRCKCTPRPFLGLFLLVIEQVRALGSHPLFECS